MNNLISLASPSHLLDINDCSLNYIVVCDNAIKAKQTLDIILHENKNQSIEGQLQDNILRVQIHDINTIAHIIDQAQKSNAIKKLLAEMLELQKNKQVQNKVIYDGFYYYNQNSKSICYFKLCNQPQFISKSQKLKNKPIFIFGIISYLLNYCTSIKQYLSNWSKIVYKNQQFKPTCKSQTKIDIFIKSLLQKQIPTLKIAEHSLQIILETANWVNNKMQTPEKKSKQIKIKPIQDNCKKFEYSDLMKLDLKNKNLTPSRLTHSSSMTSLTSSNKHRKYKKSPNHFKTTKPPKDLTKKTEQSWINTKMTNNSSKCFKPATLLASTKKSTNENWYRQDIRAQSFMKFPSKMKQDLTQQKTVANQVDLLTLLQKKQNKRNNINQQTKSNLYQHEQKENKNNFEIIPSDYLKNQRATRLNLCRFNIQVTIRPYKKQNNIRICHNIYSQNVMIRNQKKIEESKNSIQSNIIDNKNNRNIQVSNPKQNTLQKTTCSQVQNIKQSGINQIVKKNQSADFENQQKSKLTSIITKNLSFIFEFSQLLTRSRQQLRPIKVFVMLGTIYMYGYLHMKRYFQSQQNAAKCHRQNLQQKILPRFNEIIEKQTVFKDELYIISKIDLNKVQQISQDQMVKIEQITLKIMKSQYYKLKQYVVSKCSELQQKNKFNKYHILLLKVVISISLVGKIHSQNAAVSDCADYQKKINENTNINSINVKGQLSKYQYLF